MQLASNPQDPGDSEYQAGHERLRASRERYREEQYSETRPIGKNWALTLAEHDWVVRVKKLDESAEEGCQHSVEIDMQQLTEAINGEDASWADAVELAQQLFGCDDPSEAMIRGFIDGALEVLNDL
jgi:hypothetical protein